MKNSFKVVIPLRNIPDVALINDVKNVTKIRIQLQ